MIDNHNGTCSFCRSAVDPKATVCPSCNAVWDKDLSKANNVLAYLIFLAIPAGVIGFIAFFNAGSLIGLAMMGACGLWWFAIKKQDANLPRTWVRKN